MRRETFHADICVIHIHIIREKIINIFLEFIQLYTNYNNINLQILFIFYSLYFFVRILLMEINFYEIFINVNIYIFYFVYKKSFSFRRY